MDYRELQRKTRETMTEALFDLNRCFDPYRLSYLINKVAQDLGHILDETNQCVAELEGLDRK